MTINAIMIEKRTEGSDYTFETSDQDYFFSEYNTDNFEDDYDLTKFTIAKARFWEKTTQKKLLTLMGLQPKKTTISYKDIHLLCLCINWYAYKRYDSAMCHPMIYNHFSTDIKLITKDNKKVIIPATTMAEFIDIDPNVVYKRPNIKILTKDWNENIAKEHIYLALSHTLDYRVKLPRRNIY